MWSLTKQGNGCKCISKMLDVNVFQLFFFFMGAVQRTDCEVLFPVVLILSPKKEKHYNKTITQANAS